MGEKALLMFFKWGLDQSMNFAVHNLRPMPTTLAEWKDAVQDIDRQNQEFQADLIAARPFNVTAPRVNVPVTTTSVPFNRAQAHPVPRAFNATAATVPVAIPQATPDRKDNTGITFGGKGQPMDIEAARRRGVCFRCHQPGHMARVCPNRPPVNVRQLAAELNEGEKFTQQTGNRNGFVR